MSLPPLDPERRSREYDSYPLETRARVVRAWLFDGYSTRQIDEQILGHDSDRSRGYQAMGILHHLGLKAPYKGLFTGQDPKAALALFEIEGVAYARVVEHLNAPTEERTIAMASLQREETAELKVAIRDTTEARRSRLALAPAKPERVRVFSFAYKRNPDIVAEALLRAQGSCERCRRSAPFKRASDGSPYLEVHHRTSLSAGGDDSLENVIALCPNCHREVHHGQAREAEL
jgi:hypothetical protein